MKDKKPDIYPPSIFDPLLPGGIPSKPDPCAKPAPDPEGVAKDAYLGDLAKDSLAAAEDAGEVEADEDPQR